MYIVIMGVSFMKKFLVLGLALAAISCSSVYAKESAYNFEHGKSVLISSNDNNDVDFKRDGYRHKEFNRDNKNRPDIKGQKDQRKEFGKDNKRPEFRGKTAIAAWANLIKKETEVLNLMLIRTIKKI